MTYTTPEVFETQFFFQLGLPSTLISQEKGQPRFQGLSSYRPPRVFALGEFPGGGKMGDPGNEVGKRSFSKTLLACSRLSVVGD